ncbi:MAG: DUF4199 domain-containing protein [Cyclobacteriaceae bacterium]
MNTNIKNSENYLEWLAVRYGILMTAALVGFFLLMKAFELEHNLELRALNLLILSSFVLMAIDRFKKDHSEEFTYLRGIGLGLLTSAVGVLCFALLVLLYIAIINPAFMEIIREREPFGEYLNPFLVAFTIVIEGSASGFLASYAIMQYYKTSRVVKPSKQIQ